MYKLRTAVVLEYNSSFWEEGLLAEVSAKFLVPTQEEKKYQQPDFHGRERT